MQGQWVVVWAIWKRVTSYTITTRIVSSRSAGNGKFGGRIRIGLDNINVAQIWIYLIWPKFSITKMNLGSVVFILKGTTR